MNLVPELVPQSQNTTDKLVDEILFVCEFFGVAPHEILEYDIPQYLIMRNFAIKAKNEEAKMWNKKMRKR
jgi:hypothetical protein